MYRLYLIIISLLFLLFCPVIFFCAVCVKKIREGLKQRLGIRLAIRKKENAKKRVWMHASSVGEVQAAKALINHAERNWDDCEIILSTMTVQGRDVAREQFGDEIEIRLAPLDIPFIVARVLDRIQPDIYICLETELWPAMLYVLRKRKIPVVMLNGRMSERSAVSYSYFSCFAGQVLNKFDRMSFITMADMQRYIRLGADPDKCSVMGNAKYDLSLPENHQEVRARSRKLLFLADDDTLFISGSTHTGEEEQLFSIFEEFEQQNNGFVWLIAPRHINRVDGIVRFLADKGVGCDLFTELQAGKVRKNRVVVLDVMGELASLYSVAAFVFCGGTLVDKGGHNIMEAAIWDKCVFYGPSMHDFKDAAFLLESAGAGFPVNDVKDLMEKMSYFIENMDELEERNHRAGSISQAQQGAAERQVQVVSRMLSAER